MLKFELVKEYYFYFNESNVIVKVIIMKGENTTPNTAYTWMVSHFYVDGNGKDVRPSRWDASSLSEAENFMDRYMREFSVEFGANRNEMFFGYNSGN